MIDGISMPATLRAVSTEKFGTRYVERMIDQRLDSFDEAHGMPQAGMNLE
jgi:hypothetical protein